MIPSHESFHPWLLSPSPVVALVVDPTVAVAVAVAAEPGDRPLDRLVERRQLVAADGAPSPRFGHEHDEQRCGVDGAVVALPSAEHAAAAPMAQLVDDPAGLFVGDRVVLRSLEIGECEEHAAREVGVERQRHQRREQRVAAEQAS